MALKLAAALSAGGISLLLSVSRHAMAIATHLQLNRGISLQEMALLTRVFAIVSFVLLFLLPFVVGYVLAARVDFSVAYPSLTAAIGVGGGLGYLLGTAVIVPTITVTPGVIATAVLIVGTAIAVGLEVAVVGFAGGALAHLRSQRRGWSA